MTAGNPVVADTEILNKNVNNSPQAARQSIWRGSFSKIGTGSYASCILDVIITDSITKKQNKNKNPPALIAITTYNILNLSRWWYAFTFMCRH